MCLYSHQISFTSSAWRSLLGDPNDYLAVIRTPVESLGGNLVNAFFTQDSYDVLAIADFPSTVSPEEISIAFYAAGAIARI
ncbi:MAG: GYD domain-containing protein, partial [Candidatus Acidiferrum sp.]